MIFIETTTVCLLLFYSSSIRVQLPTVTHLEMRPTRLNTLRMHNDIHANHKHLAAVVLFHKYECATPYSNTSGDYHPHDRTPCTSTMVFKETTSIRPLLFYSSSIRVPLPTVTHLKMTTHTIENPVHAQWYSWKPQAFGYCCSIPQVWVFRFLL